MNASELLVALAGIDSSRDAGAGGEGVSESRLVSGIEYARAATGEEAKLRRAWRGRRGGGATPLVVVADDPDGGGTLRVLGPQGDGPVRRICADAMLDMVRRTVGMTRLEAVRHLAQEVERLETGGVAGLSVRVLGVARRGPWVVALAAYSAVFAIATWPLVTRMGSATYGGQGDGWALIWQTWYRARHGLSYFSSPVDSGLAWPFGLKIPSAPLLSNVTTEWPTVALIRLGAGGVLANNLVLMGVTVASALAMYAVARRLGARPAVAFWAGLVYIIAPWELDRVAIHLTLSFLAAFPLLLLGIVEWTRRPSWRAGALVVGATALAVYTHAYYGFAAGVVLVACLPIVLVAMARRPGRPRDLLALGTLTAAIAVVAAPLAIAVTFQSAGISQQLNRPLHLTEWALDPRLLLLPSVENPVFGGFSRQVVGDNPVASQTTGELALYLGWVTLALAAVGIWAAVTRRTARLPIVVAGVAAALGFGLALPATVNFPVLGPTSMPVSYAQHAVTFISTPARFFVLLLTAVIVMAALGLEVLVSGRSRRTARLIVAGAIVFSLVELPVWVSGRVVDATTPPPVITAISRLVPAGEPIIQYPSAVNGLPVSADQFFWQIVHGHPLVNGALTGSPEDAVREVVSDPTRAQTPSELALLGVHWATYEAQPVFFPRIPEYHGIPRPEPGFRVVERFPGGSMIMRVTAAPASEIVVLGEGFEAPEGGRVDWRWIIGSHARLLVCATSAGPYRLRMRVRGFAVPRVIDVGGVRVHAPTGGEGVADEVPVRLDRGWQWVTIQLVGSSPVRPLTLDPSSTDGRPLAVEITPPTLLGGPSVGDPQACHAPLPR